MRAGDLIVENDLAAAFPDGFPISPGHMLVVPKRHEADFFPLSESEQVAILHLTRQMQGDLAESTDATAFNVAMREQVPVRPWSTPIFISCRNTQAMSKTLAGE